MNDDRTTPADQVPNAEPALTQKNAGTIRGEIDLSEDTSFDDANIEQLDDESGKRDS